MTKTEIVNLTPYIIMDLSHLEKDLISAGWAERLDGANLFFFPNYMAFSQAGGKKCIYVYSNCFVIPVLLSSKSAFKYAAFPSEPYRHSDGDEKMEAFVEETCEYLRKVYKIQWIQATPPSALFMSAPKNSKSIPFGSHVIDLSLTEEELWGKVHSKHRNVIKKAEKDGVEIVSGTDDKLIEDYHSIDIETWKRSNKNATGQESLRNQVRALGDDAIIYMAYLDGKPQSGAFFFYNKAMCYYMHGANCDKPHTGAGNLLQWKAILGMKETGVTKYSFVGCRINEDENSKFHGIQRFKERFGGELMQCYMFKVVYSPLMYNLYRMLVNLRMSIAEKKIVKQEDIIDQEWHKWKK